MRSSKRKTVLITTDGYVMDAYRSKIQSAVTEEVHIKILSIMMRLATSTSARIASITTQESERSNSFMDCPAVLITPKVL